METTLQRLAEAIRTLYCDLAFTMLEIGARPLGEAAEPFHLLLKLFPKSRILAFEIEEQLCADLNDKAGAGIQYFPVALGRAEEKRLLYETVHPMCSSLYKPLNSLLNRYNNLEVAMLRHVNTVDTVSIDHFIGSQSIQDVDFMKIDIQGAELDVFCGGCSVLNKLVAIVSEVEFIPLYHKQPLFGDVCAFLTGHGLMFHKFLGLAGRTLYPLVIDNNKNYATQHMWSDAMFIKNVEDMDKLSTEKLLKLGLLAFLYGSQDVTYYCLSLVDQRNGSSLSSILIEK